MRRRVLSPIPVAVFASALMAAACGGQSSGSSAGSVSPTAPSTTTTTPTAPTTATGSYAYAQDVKPILDADCIRCHGGSRPSAGVDLSSYASAMRYVTAGNANSTLVLVTRSGGLMNGYLTGDRAGKADIIRQWVVNGAPQAR